MKRILMMSAMVFALSGGAALADNHGEGKGPGKKFEKADTNGDGVISKDEFIAKQQERAQKHFEKMDADGSGDLSKDEIKAGREKMRDHMKDKMQDRREKRQERREERSESDSSE